MTLNISTIQWNFTISIWHLFVLFSSTQLFLFSTPVQSNTCWIALPKRTRSSVYPHWWFPFCGVFSVSQVRPNLGNQNQRSNHKLRKMHRVELVPQGNVVEWGECEMNAEHFNQRSQQINVWSISYSQYDAPQQKSEQKRHQRTLFVILTQTARIMVFRAYLALEWLFIQLTGPWGVCLMHVLELWKELLQPHTEFSH